MMTSLGAGKGGYRRGIVMNLTGVDVQDAPYTKFMRYEVPSRDRGPNESIPASDL